MVRNIATVIYENGVKVTMMESLPVAEKILAMQERVGMLPPFSSKAAAKSNHIDAPGYEWDTNE